MLAGKPSVAIIGGGHNALTAAAYLARAGVEVTVLERLPHVGGAAVSTSGFAGLDARLSRYSYLVSLLPEQIIRDLGLDVRLARRRYSSYTPVPHGHPAGADRGLLIDAGDEAATRASFAAIGAAGDADGFGRFYDRTTRLAAALFPTLTEPLPTRDAARAAAGDASAWSEIVDAPIADAIERAVADDLVRGVIATDALIGTFAALDDPGLEQNRCLLYHVIGGGTGDWDVPIGGMGRVSGGLEAAARAAGATILTGVTVTSVTPDGEVTWEERFGGSLVGSAGARSGTELTAQFDLVLSAVAPHVLAGLLGTEADGAAGDAATSAAHAAWPRPEGAQVKVNMLLRRLPRLRDRSVSPEAAFGGTFHINETYAQLGAAHAAASAGRVPEPLPCEIYCHSLTDPTILGDELRASGAHTLTVFGLHVPDRLLNDDNNERMRGELERAVLVSLDSVLAEPIEPLLLQGTGPDGTAAPAIETKTTLDIEAALAMPGGNIFHGPLSWPWLESEPTGPAEAWGVETPHERILMAGSGARRGGAVSGIGGHNAAHAALELLAASLP
ncbi:Phytoene dehydrogenase-related protein [Agrococcus baldri]|uniref:Phytoene dehydrogenase-related protein n=1 Tax=Agrococcus baldri TaxID=153730 RepID=A0AA94HMF7_9MICO|nr:NAD(P)/FAD-dependent oxidoreductase [Agrococcus baldri]SFS10910.1 Phytoene dehydrogenase-related protein [Agrococcus baldri]